MAFERMRIFTGNANPKLAEAVCRHLNISLGRCVVGRFSDGEVMVELLENVRGRDVFILQSTCAPTNDNLMEVLVMVDALKRASSSARMTGSGGGAFAVFASERDAHAALAGMPPEFTTRVARTLSRHPLAAFAS